MSTTRESLNVRISLRSKLTLKQLAKSEGKPMQAVLDEAIERLRREKFFKQLDVEYGRLKGDTTTAWKEELEERALWESTLMDGIEKE